MMMGFQVDWIIFKTLFVLYLRSINIVYFGISSLIIIIDFVVIIIITDFMVIIIDFVIIIIYFLKY
jgi:hypothetical protein